MSIVGIQNGAVSACVSRRSEEHTSELQSLRHLVCRLLLEKKKMNCSKGTSKFFPDATVRKSWRSSKGRIQRLRSSLGLHRWRQKSSIRKTPQLALRYKDA